MQYVPISTSPALRMTRSGIRAVMELALADPEAIRLEIGEPDTPTPAHVLDAAAADARAGHTGYTSSGGTAELRAALAAKLAAVNGLDGGPGAHRGDPRRDERHHAAAPGAAGPG